MTRRPTRRHWIDWLLIYVLIPTICVMTLSVIFSLSIKVI